MLIRDITVRNFRKLVGPVRICDLSDGITIIAGDNEEGKSTLLAALRCVLFDKHRLTGEDAEAMQPFNANVRPEIELRFDADGASYHLRKAFCQSPEAELVSGLGRITGPAVEERLKELLRFEPPAKGASRVDHQGIFGMLWVEQGRAFQELKLNRQSRTTLVSALEGEVGQVLGGQRGRALLDAVAKAHDAHFTPTGRPKGEYAAAGKAAADVEAEATALRTQLQAYEEKVDELGRVLSRLRDHEAHDARGRAASDLGAAEQEHQRVFSLEAKLREAASSVRLAEAELAGPEARWRRRDADVNAVGQAAEEFARRKAQLDAAEQLLEERQAGIDGIRQAVAAVRAAAKAAEAEVREAEHLERSGRLAAQHRELSGRARQAAEATEAMELARASAQAIKVDAKQLSQIRAADRKAIEARASLMTSASIVEFYLGSGTAVTANGAPVALNASLSITERTEIGLGGLGSIVVQPGGKDLAERRAAADAAERHLAGLLATGGVPDLVEAERKSAERQALLADAEAQLKLVKAHAPEGLDALRAQIRDAQAALEAIGASLDEAPAVDAAAAAARLKVALESRRRGEAELAARQSELSAAESSLNAAREAASIAQSEHASANRAAAGLAASLEQGRAEQSDEALRQAVLAGSAAIERAQAVQLAASADLAAADPEAVALRHENAQKALEQVNRDIERLTHKRLQLEGELQGLGRHGLGERLQDAEGRLERASANRDRIEREARALKLLLDTLRAAERSAKETFMLPIRAKVEPYLRLLFPNAELLLDDEMAVSHVRRAGVEEPFSALSVGTREQVAVLTRLAFADLLRDKGASAPIILDDALVNSDDDRFERMSLILRKASARHQIIVLTCHERHYRALGAPVIRLDDCRVAG